jgi:hypothetical protein
VAYAKQTWQDKPATTTPTSAARLNYMETGIESAAQRADDAYTLAQSGGGSITVQDEGIEFPARPTLNFVGAGVSATDDPTNNRVVVSVPGGGATTVPRPLHLRVVSADAPQYVKDGADYVCDGTADQAEINAALTRAAALPARGGPTGAEQHGKVELSGGRFNLSGSVLVYTAEWLCGQGNLTELRAVGLTAVTGSGAAPAMIKKAVPEGHLIRVSHMLVNGSYASGGAGCHGVYFDGAGSTGTGGYPGSSPDTDHWIHDLFIDGMDGSVRHGIYIATSSGTAAERGSTVYSCQIRNIGGDGIRYSAASDCFIDRVHIGTVNGDGIHIAAGNTKINNAKTFYCDTRGFYLSSGRGIITACESQDNNIGYMFDGSPWVANSLSADTSNAAGIQVSTDRLVLNGFSIYQRSGARYATGQRGLWFDTNSYADLMVIGQIDDPNITTRIAGTPGPRSFMRVSDGTSLVTFG